RGCGCNTIWSSVALRVARPKCFPPATHWRRQQRLRSRMQNLAFSKIHQQHPIIVLSRKISEHKSCRAEYCAVDSSGILQPKPRIFATQFEEIDMQIVKVAILFAFRKV